MGEADLSFDLLSYSNNSQSYSDSCFNTNMPGVKFFSSWLNGNIRKSVSKHLSLLREVRLKVSNSGCCGTLNWVSEPTTTSQCLIAIQSFGVLSLLKTTMVIVPTTMIMAKVIRALKIQKGWTR